MDAGERARHCVLRAGLALSRTRNIYGKGELFEKNGPCLNDDARYKNHVFVLFASNARAGPSLYRNGVLHSFVLDHMEERVDNPDQATLLPHAHRGFRANFPGVHF